MASATASGGRAGRGGGGLCYRYDVVAGEERGGRTINPAEAAIVQRIFEVFAVGQSPLAIAHQLNDEGVPGPRAILWRDTAIRGHRQRGAGLLNNELYIGRQIWDRLRYVKDPQLNAREAWVKEDVPDCASSIRGFGIG